MEITKATELLNKYKNCLECGNKYTGDGEGKLIIDNDSFYRSCKCGFEVSIRHKESGKSE